MKYVLLLGCALLAYAAEPWSKHSAQWTSADAQQVLTDSPWAQPASASFATTDPDQDRPIGPVPNAPGMSGPNAASDGRWDGGVGRIPHLGNPTLDITIRWDSALPVRQALKLIAKEPPAPASNSDYVITVIGLVPAGRYRSAGRLPTQSRSDDGSTIDPQDPEQMLEGLMGQSRLMPRGEKAIAPDDVKLDAASGALHLFFPRTERLSLKTKEVVFATRFGSMTIYKRFRLKDMRYEGKLEL